ncbi:MAG: SDR family NAD(P)-dependent oxidoreductase [Candidatus Promineifilaceae bacterium]|nr:SDR family NAD(P)-dependent oxidoreductase [Candidatus Promineifilaceae bacterium]
MFDFSNKIVIITGAAGNLGKTTTMLFHQAGARVAVVDKEREVMRVVFGDTIAEDQYCFFTTANLLDERAVNEMVERIVNHYGRIDVLVNIAGGFKMGSPVHETTLDTWESMLNLNARSVFFVCRAVIPHLLQQGSGKIVSVAARAALKGKAKMASYVVSKDAVIRLTESMSAELRDYNINVNCVLPGTIDTKRNREEMPNADFNKWIKPSALADVILFLASDYARAIHGAAIPVYGKS